ncbi:hypothetical protein PVAND_007300 [Polypedilum vanderplanki]|nr:hypothetical protein PVAND_007300 [Polypedilum vanderplanki]
MLTTFKNQQQQQIDSNDQQKTNEFLWHYQLSQCDLSKKIKASSHCNLNILRNHHQHHHLQQQHELHNVNNHCNSNSINPLIATETRFHNSLENQTTL